MRARLIAIGIILLMSIPAVAGSDIVCNNHLAAPDLKLECELTDNANESVKLYLKSFNGITVDSWIWAIKYIEDWDGKIVVNPRREYVFAPFNFSMNLENSMREAAESVWLEFEHYWVFYNKENILRFVIIHKDGRIEEKNVTVYISGRVPYPWEDREVLGLLLEFGFVFAILGSIILLAKLIEALRVTRAEETFDENNKNESRLKPSKPSRSFLIFSALLFFYLGHLASPWVVYFLATPFRIASDVKLLLLGSVLLGLTLEWLFFVRNAKKSGYSYLIREAPITGLEWVPLAMFPFGVWPMLIGFLAFFFLFLVNQDYEVNRLMRKTALPASVFAASALVLLVGGDAAFIAGFLVLAFIHPYLIASKIKSAPSIEEIPVTQRSPEVRELLETFDRVLRERKMEGEL